MKILHYALGFPPYRTGGSIKFCMDLMRQQSLDGHRTALLWPGRMGMFYHKVQIRNRGIVFPNGNAYGVQSFEIINPLPVPYDEGIAEFGAFEKSGGQEAYKKLLDSFAPDIIHIHTLMGLHDSFPETAKRRNIRCIFTAHDFFPICPKVTMVRHGQVCSSAEGCTDCGKCNTTALSLTKIRLLQSPLYRILKDTAVIRGLRTFHRNRYLSGELEMENENEDVAAAGQAEDYKKLREHYYSMLKAMDMIHYNSSVTKGIYESYFSLPDSVVINISHGDIGDHRKKKEFTPGRLRMTYLGQQGKAKGFFLLQSVLDKLWKTKKFFRLNIYFTPKKMSSYMKIHDRYSYSELESIFDDTDLLVVPSVWKETFGYVVLEALSYGVPVLISGNVGARDILAEGAGIVVEDINAGSLYQSLDKITDSRLSEMNRTILEKQEILTLRRMAGLLEKQCYQVGWL